MMQQFKIPLKSPTQERSPSPPSHNRHLSQKSPKSNYMGRSSRKKVSQSLQNHTRIAQLHQLQRQITLKRPNNITRFIRDWANSKINKLTRGYNHEQYPQSQEEEEFQFHMKKSGNNPQRRFALVVHNQQYNKQADKQVQKIQKLEETKSIILIKLKNMDMLRCLNNEGLWALVEQFKQKQVEDQQIIIKRNQLIKTFYIIVNGQIAKTAQNKKQNILHDGYTFGQQSLLFETPSKFDYISNKNCRLAFIQGRIISRLIRQTNQQKHQTICRALQRIQFMKYYHIDEVERIADIAMNQAIMDTQPQQEVIMEIHASFFIVLQGLFYSYIRRLNQRQLRKENNRQFKKGDAFGEECLRRQRNSDAIISQQYGALIEIKCVDIERVLGPLAKVEKRKKKRM